MLRIRGGGSRRFSTLTPTPKMERRTQTDWVSHGYELCHHLKKAERGQFGI